MRLNDWGKRARQRHRVVVMEVGREAECLERWRQEGARMVEKIRERQAEWEVGNAGRQRSRELGMGSKQAGRAASSRDLGGGGVNAGCRQDGVGESHPTN